MFFEITRDVSNMQNNCLKIEMLHSSMQYLGVNLIIKRLCRIPQVNRRSVDLGLAVDLGMWLSSPSLSVESLA